MQEGKVVFRFLLPTHEDATKAIHPAMSALDHPTTRFEPRFLSDGLGFLAAGTNMGGKAELSHNRPHFVIVIAFVETEILPLLDCGLRALGYDTFKRGAHQFHVMAISSGYRQTDGHTLSFSQQAALDAGFAAVGGIRADFSPHPVALSSSHHPCSTIPTQCLATRQPVLYPLAITSGTHRLLPILGSGRAPSKPDRCPFHPTPSTGSQFARRRRCHRHRHGLACADAHHQSDACSRVSAATLAAQPRVRR